MVKPGGVPGPGNPLACYWYDRWAEAESRAAMNKNSRGLYEAERNTVTNLQALLRATQKSMNNSIKFLLLTILLIWASFKVISGVWWP